jgi:hypothetical protein
VSSFVHLESCGANADILMNCLYSARTLKTVHQITLSFSFCDSQSVATRASTRRSFIYRRLCSDLNDEIETIGMHCTESHDADWPPGWSALDSNQNCCPLAI